MRLFNFTILVWLTAVPGSAQKQPNILMLVADDLGYEVMDFLEQGRVGEGLQNDTESGLNLTPNISSLAKSAMSFQNAHNNVSICAPSRGTLATGLYPHRSGLMGFVGLREKHPTLFGVLKANGYLTGILGKVHHSTCDQKFKWDYKKLPAQLGAGRAPSLYRTSTEEFLKRCKEEAKPFFLMVNSHDPHRPFHNPAKPVAGSETPSKLYTIEDVIVPKHLPDNLKIRQDLARYYNSVRRLDDAIGVLLRTLDESGLAEDTLVMFLSDNGSAYPFAKSNTYFASSRTPLLIRWPGKTTPGTVDKEHMIASIDLFPTLLEAAGLPIPETLDGRSFASLLKGNTERGRGFVYTQVDYLVDGDRPVPMRCVQSKDYAYIFNAFANGTTKFHGRSGSYSLLHMKEAAQDSPAVKSRIAFLESRTIEELYDLHKDPACLKNLILDPELASVASEYRERAKAWMTQTGDPCLAAFLLRKDHQRLFDWLDSYPPILAHKIPKPKKK